MFRRADPQGVRDPVASRGGGRPHTRPWPGQAPGARPRLRRAREAALEADTGADGDLPPPRWPFSLRPPRPARSGGSSGPSARVPGPPRTGPAGPTSVQSPLCYCHFFSHFPNGADIYICQNAQHGRVQVGELRSSLRAPSWSTPAPQPRSLPPPPELHGGGSRAPCATLRALHALFSVDQSSL